jgi:hypothetical protein
MNFPSKIKYKYFATVVFSMIKGLQVKINAENSEIFSCSESELMTMDDSEEESSCEGCRFGFECTNFGFAEDFIWHPSKKY